MRTLTRPQSERLNARSAPLRFGLIGFGGIAHAVLDLLERERPGGVACAGVLVRPGRRGEAAAELRGAVPVLERLDDLLALDCSLIADCAGHAALRAHGVGILEGGRDLLTVSAGALADPALESALLAAAARQGGRVVVPAGAIAGIDALVAARHGGLTRVAYAGRKPVSAWRGTAAEQAVDLSSLVEPTVFFEGDARQAALAYPMNANVAATIALAGIGFAGTTVRLVADPAGAANLHEIEFEGAFGRARVEIAGRPSPGNPRTSMLTALSVWRAILDEAGATIVVAPPAAEAIAARR